LLSFLSVKSLWFELVLVLGNLYYSAMWLLQMSWGICSFWW